MGSGVVNGIFVRPADTVAARGLRGSAHSIIAQAVLWSSAQFHRTSQHEHRQDCKVVVGCPKLLYNARHAAVATMHDAEKT